jgi:hypothetical protein
MEGQRIGHNLKESKPAPRVSETMSPFGAQPHHQPTVLTFIRTMTFVKFQNRRNQIRVNQSALHNHQHQASRMCHPHGLSDSGVPDHPEQVGIFLAQ